jgi:FtsH-binding integral membrane protein
MAYMEYTQTIATPTAAERDQGLRAFMISIFNRMTVALAVSGVVAMLTAALLGPALKGSMLALVFALTPLAFVLVLSFGIHKLSYGTANMLFWLFAVSMGLSLSTIFLTYTTTSIASTFFITSATFASASLIGYTTKRDLTNMGTFLLMGLIGILIASIVNIFLASSMLAFIVSVLGVVIFTGLTAYDCQNLKNDYLTQGEVYGFDSPEKSALFGALSLYLNFVNIFQMLLSLLGNRQD